MSVINSLIKVDVVDRQDVYLICSYDENKKYLRVILLDQNEDKAFSGQATDIDLRSQAATINMSLTAFLSLTLKALTKSKSDGDKFLYSIDKNCEGFVFKWKSVDQDETIVHIGSLKVTENDYKSMTKDAFFLLSEELINLREKLANMNESVRDLKKEIENSVHSLTDTNAMKERIESELYSKFILVLNEKKQKIRDLKRKACDTSPDTVIRKQTNTMKSRKVHQISDSSDEGVSDPEIMNAACPSTSKCNRSLLFFDDDEPQVSISPSKKRSRTRGTASKKHEQEITKSKAKPAVAIESESEDELMKFL